MSVNEFTRATSQLSIRWLKLAAFSKVRCIFVTLLVSQPPIAWSKMFAFWNVLPMFVTELVSHSSGWLNAGIRAR